jgi:predicted phage tail protein
LNSPTTITLSWSPPVETNKENITQYIIERLVLNDEWIHFLNTSKTNKTIANLNVGEIYKFRVRAVNKYGISDPLVIKLSIKAFDASKYWDCCSQWFG